MAEEAKVTYLYNSGFAVELPHCVLVFDYYLDAVGALPAILRDAVKKKAYFFVSHAHFDHWNNKIGNFSAQAALYFLSYDVDGDAFLPREKTVVLDRYDCYADDFLRVDTFSSTDRGVSFYVTVDGWRIFHAGDFNWWHWKDEIPTNIVLAKNGFFKQLKKMAGLKSDIAFFPVDGRLEEFKSCGLEEFCRSTNPFNIVAMHNLTGKPWDGAAAFEKKYAINLWQPQKSGETRVFSHKNR